jgi:ABC-type branched-subunit amino acid transport system substrate-binding protein
LEAANMQKVTGLGLESYVATHLMAEAIRRAGRDITREKLRAALASVRSFEMGELNYGFPEAPPYVAGSIVKMGVFDADALLRT